MRLVTKPSVIEVMASRIAAALKDGMIKERFRVNGIKEFDLTCDFEDSAFSFVAVWLLVSCEL